MTDDNVHCERYDDVVLVERLVRGWDRSLHLATKLIYLDPGADPARHGVRVHRNVPYAQTGRRAHLLDVYQPEDTTRSPALLYVHGGGFAVLSKDTHRVMALAFSSQGYTVFNINYSIGPRHRYPAPLEDAGRALEWVAAHGAEYGADTSRLILAGESAGANLVTALAYAATHPRPEPYARALYDANMPIAAVLPIYGLLDLNDVERLCTPRVPWYIRRAIHGAAAAYVGHPAHTHAWRAPLASPLRLIEREPGPDARPLPPFFVACGTADPLLPDSKRLQAALEARGVPSELSVHPGEIHGFNAMVWRPEARAKWRAAFGFLERLGLAPKRRRSSA